MDAKTSFRPSQTHSEVSPQKTCEIPTLDCGKLTVGYFPRVTAPLTLKSAPPGARLALAGRPLELEGPHILR